MSHIHQQIACSQTLYFLFKVRRARVIKNNPRVGGGGVIDRQHKGVGVGKKKIDIFFYRAPRSLADVFRKNEKKNKTTSGYRL